MRMEMNMIYTNIKYMKDKVTQTIKDNAVNYTNIITSNPTDNSWLFEEFEDPFEEKKFQIESLDFSKLNALDDDEITYQLSIRLYKSLKSLPKYVLSNENFWAWINFDLGYHISQRLIKLSDDKSSTILNHYFFSEGVRRGKFFGVFSRLYFRAELTYDKELDDHFYLTKIVNQYPKTFRNLSWRTYSNNYELVKKILKIQIKLEMKFGKKMTSKVYEKIAKHISNLGSSLYVDLLTHDELEIMIESFTEDILSVCGDETIS